MSNEVFANNNEISCKSGDGKVIASFPDVCLTPPSPPAGPIPIPYPVSSFSSDTTNGSKTVKINRKPIMLKDKSYFKKCTGDEPATKSQGMGVVSHQITGKVYYVAWSMDVKVEGLNVCRNLDLTSSNHASPTANTPPVPPELEGVSLPPTTEPCECKYEYKHRKGSPTASQRNHVNQPGKKCWRPNCKTPDAGPFIADHQPSLVERWYKGGCHDPKFNEKAKSTPGKPTPDQQEYKELKPRCRNCFRKAYTNIGLPPPDTPSGRMSEGLMERAKSKKFQRQTQEQFGVTPRKC